MALTNCKECSKEVSKKAEKCPHCGAPLKKQPTQYGCGTLILLGFVIYIFTSIFSSNDTSTPPHQYTVAEKLAIIDSNPGREATYDRLLNSLMIKCDETRISVSDTAVRGTQVMKEKRGMSMSALEFLGAMDGSIPDGLTTMNCTEIAAALITLTGS